MDEGEYALILGCSRNYVNAMVNHRVPGTSNLLEKALRHAKLDWDDVLDLPPGTPLPEDEAALNAMKKAIARGGEDRQYVLDQAHVLELRVKRLRAKRRVRRPAQSAA